MNRPFAHRCAAAAVLYAGLIGISCVVIADDRLRPLTTDRPDLTESPFTVNADHIQVETNLVGFARSRTDPDGVRQESFEFATTNVRVGLTHNSELNVSWQPYGVVNLHLRGRTPNGRQTGVGSLQLRAKVNLFGNDTFDQVGDMALAVLPFVTLPTDDNNGISVSDVEGGIIVPFAIVLPHNFGLGLNAGISAVHSGGAAGYDAEVFLSAALAYEWTARFGTYYEVAAMLRADASLSLIHI